MAFKPTFCIIIIIIIIIIILVVLFAYNSTQFSAASAEYLQTGTTLFRLFDADDDDVYLRTDCKIPLWIGRPVLGIDLGTSYSRVGLCQSTSVYEKECHVEIIADDHGNRAIPSWVAFTDNGTLIGEAAKNQSDSNPERTIFNVQRLIGRKFDDPQVQEDVKTLPYKVVNKDGRPYIEVKIRDGETKAFSPEEISAMILRKLKEMAESYLGEGIQNAAIIVPDYFNESQRLATKIAGAIAGFNVACVIKRPTHLLIDNPVNPDEAAAYEAAVWGWSICDTTGLGFSSTFSLSGLSIGIETGGEIMKKLIQTNTFIPTWRSHVFSTYRDNQTTVLIKVYAGERALTRDCIELGSFELSGIPPAPRGVPQIEVGIGIDPYYFIQATAQDKTTNKSISITLPNEATWLTLDYDFLDKIREAVVFAVEDREVKEKIKERYKLEAFDITNAITDGGEFDDVIESDDNKRIEDTSREGNEWLDCNQNADMDEGKVKDLENVCSPIAKKVQEKDRAESSDLQIEEESKDEL